MMPPRTPRHVAEFVSPDVQARRDEYDLVAQIRASRRAEHRPPVKSPEATAEAFGRAAFEAYGVDWPKLMEIARGAAIRAHGDAMGVK